MIRDSNAYRILVMEDNEGDYAIVEDFLTELILNPEIIQAHSFTKGVELLDAANIPFDIILLDLRLPDKNGQELITAILQHAGLCPVIILTGYSDISFSIKSIGEGILDYLLKDEMTATILYKSILYAIERKKNMLELKSSQQLYSDLFDLSPQPMCLYETGTYRFLKVNKAAMKHYEYSEQEFLEMTLLDLVPPEDKQKLRDMITGQTRVLNHTYEGFARNYKKSGELIEVETFSTPVIINDKPATLVIAIDVTLKNQYEKNLIEAIIKTQEEERYEIGGELHDNVCQILATSNLIVNMVKETLPPIKAGELGKCGEYINLALTEIRNLSHRLAPVFFGQSTLEESFKKLFTTFDPEGRTENVFHFDKAVNKCAISVELQLNMYRVLQEQLRNIVKYANASRIDVYLSVDNGLLQMKISDNGVGFDVNTAGVGIGFANMQRRINLFAGTCTIISSPGNGCDVNIAIPVPPGDAVVANE